MLRRLAAMRAAKVRKRLEHPPEPEPKMERYFPLSWGLRDEAAPILAWMKTTHPAVIKSICARNGWKFEWI